MIFLYLYSSLKLFLLLSLLAGCGNLIIFKPFIAEHYRFGGGFVFRLGVHAYDCAGKAAVGYIGCQKFCRRFSRIYIFIAVYGIHKSIFLSVGVHSEF